MKKTNKYNLTAKEFKSYQKYKKKYEVTPSNLLVEKEIKSLSKFQHFLKKEIGVRISDCVFRGENDYEGNQGLLTPYIFRPNNLEIDEKALINGVVNEKPHEFTDMKNTLDILIKMQHYQIPTRLLDISFNPYKALYFALGNNEVDGYFYIINTSDKQIKHDNITTIQPINRKTIDSDTVAIVSSLALLTENPVVNLRKLFGFSNVSKLIIYNMLILDIEETFDLPCTRCTYGFENSTIEISKGICELFEKSSLFNSWVFEELKDFKDLLESMLSDSEIDMIEWLYHFYKEDYFYLEALSSLDERFLKSMVEEVEKMYHKKIDTIEEYYDICNGEISELEQKEEHYIELIRRVCSEYSKEMNNLTEEVKNFKPGFVNRICIDDLFRDYLILPRNNNQRIINQEGGFILFGIKPTDGPSRKSVCLDSEIIRIKIPKDKKKTILKDLETYHRISESYIYPELDHYNYRNFQKEKY